MCVLMHSHSVHIYIPEPLRCLRAWQRVPVEELCVVMGFIYHQARHMHMGLMDICV